MDGHHDRRIGLMHSVSREEVTNWAGNVTFSAERLLRPRTVADVQRLVGAADKIRVLGTGHSFNRLADTPGTLVSLAGLSRVVDIDRVAQTVRVDGGITFAELAGDLRGSGLALANMASLPHISLAGACATGTHGSGHTNQVLAASVRALTLVSATGDLVHLERGSTTFPGAVLSLGRLGVVVDMVIDLVPDFQVAQTVVEHVDEGLVGADLESVLTAAYSVSMCTNWAPEPRMQVWVKEKVGRPEAWAGTPRWGGRLATGPRHMLEGMPPRYATEQLGVPGPWAERLPHFRADFMPSSGAELQSEYLIPMRHASTAWNALAQVRDRIAPVLQGCEVRCVVGDDLWLSPTAATLCVGYHFTWIPDGARIMPAVRLVEDLLTDFDARPHWGKIFTTSADELAARYPRLSEFQGLVADLDPRGKFGNEQVDTWLRPQRGVHS
jgi:alditol oxidase